MRRLAVACLLAGVPGSYAADPPLKAGFSAPAPAKDGDKKAPEKKDEPKKKEEPKTVELKKLEPKKETSPDAAVPTKDAARVERMKATIQMYATQCASYVDYLNGLPTEKEKAEALKFLPSPAFAAGNAARLVLADPKDAAAFEGLTWLLKYQSQPAVAKVLEAVPGGTPNAERTKLDVAGLLLEHHAANPRLAGVIRTLQTLSDANAEFLTKLIDKSSDVSLKAQAALHLADLYNSHSEKPDLPAAEREKSLTAAEKLLAPLAENPAFAELKLGRGTAAEQLASELRSIRTLSVGKKLPVLKGESLEGSPVSTEDYKGKVVVLDVWATWCGPCRAMIPHEREMTKKLKDKPFAFVSISCDAKKETLTEFLEKEPMPWTHWFDGQRGKVSQALNIKFFPTIYVIDTKGVIRYKNIRNQQLEHAVEKLLAEATEKPSGGQ